MKYNMRLGKHQARKKNAEINKNKKNKKRLKKFDGFKCAVCGKPTKYHHKFCKKHHHLSKL